ncbi:hypothetical protein B0I71DRAFT_137988 [Yarrowia lipolytica]|uniref:Uncharacterized protein n=1 Tax=Yarrowia lipolytica TaxID=4952 RepID=A0A371CE90_YARLL|nr:hypothetical protein B0I71DRAFT_137988 [Yarrowia lipolytica]
MRNMTLSRQSLMVLNTGFTSVEPNVKQPLYPIRDWTVVRAPVDSGRLIKVPIITLYHVSLGAVAVGIMCPWTAIRRQSFLEKGSKFLSFLFERPMPSWWAGYDPVYSEEALSFSNARDEKFVFEISGSERYLLSKLGSVLALLKRRNYVTGIFCASI